MITHICCENQSSDSLLGLFGIGSLVKEIDGWIMRENVPKGLYMHIF